MFNNKAISMILMIQLLACCALAQHRNKKYLYGTNKTATILSETIKLDRDSQSFNSLFIWRRDMVVRIIFKYIQKLPDNFAIKHGAQITSLEKFIPAIKKVGSYGEDKSNYTDKFKTAINNWNRKNNPSADKLGYINISDGDPEVLLRNTKRESEYANNFPLIIKFPNSNSLFLIKPYYINIYKLDNELVGSNLNFKDVKRYTLFSSVSLLEDSFLDVYNEGYSGFIKSFIINHTLPFLYSIPLPHSKYSLIKSLSNLPLAERKVDDDEMPPLRPIRIDGDQNYVETQRQARLRDSIRQYQSLKESYQTQTQFEPYQYCPICYDIHIPKPERVKIHCPLKVSSNETIYPVENWAYSFSSKNIHYFEVESPDYSQGVSPDPTFFKENVMQWLLMSPGKGFWMTNMAHNNRDLKRNIRGLTVNGEPISSW